MTHHPHVHMIVPGGGIALDGERWISCRPGFLLPVRVLSRLFRRLFLKKLTAAQSADRLGFFGDHAGVSERRAFAQIPGAAQEEELVRLCQAALRRTRSGDGLPGALHTPRRHRQQPPDRP
jgi:hypothetical protein